MHPLLKSLAKAVLLLSGQQPHAEALQFLRSIPAQYSSVVVLAEFPSGQHPNLLVEQSSLGLGASDGVGVEDMFLRSSAQPWNLGPRAGRILSGQQPNLDVLQEGFSVVISGHPVPFSFSAVVTPSGQQPNNSSRQREGGQPFNLGPLAGDTPSGQHLNSVSLQVITSGQPALKGPLAAVIPSKQHPNSVLSHLGFFGFFFLHFFRVTSFTMAVWSGFREVVESTMDSVLVS